MKQNLVKISLLLTFLFFVICVGAQDVKPLTFGVNVGIGISNMNDGDGNTAKIKPAYQVGLSLDVAFTPNIYMFTGAEFAVKGSKKNIKDESISTDYNINAQYIQVPLYFGCKFDIANADSRLVFAIGPYFSYGIGGNTTIQEVGDDSKEKIGTFKDDFLKPFDCGFGGRMGLEYRKIHFEIVANLGLVNTAKQIDEKQRLATASLVVGYTF